MGFGLLKTLLRLLVIPKMEITDAQGEVPLEYSGRILEIGQNRQELIRKIRTDDTFFRGGATDSKF